MIALRTLAMAIATLAIAGCASSGYNDGYYQPQPGYAYQPGYYGQPYYGGGYSAFGYDSDFDDDFDRDSNRYFHPAHGITCDRARDVCFDRYGLSYDATKRYLGEREANRAVHKYDDKILFYSPKRGITCDRRQHFCSDADGFNEKWTDRIFGDNAASQPPAQGGNNGNFAIRPDKQHQQEEPWWMRSSKHSYSDDNDDDNVRVLPPVQIHPNRLVDNNPPPAVLLPQAQPQGAVNNDSPAADDANGFAYRPGTPKRVYQPSNNDGDDTSSGNVCPPKGCSNK